MRIVKRLKSQIRQPIKLNLSDRDMAPIMNPWQELRDRLQMTGEEVTDLTGQSPHTWSYYENPSKLSAFPEPKLQTLVKLADALGCDLIVEFVPRRKL